MILLKVTAADAAAMESDSNTPKPSMGGGSVKPVNSPISLNPANAVDREELQARNDAALDSLHGPLNPGCRDTSNGPAWTSPEDQAKASKFIQGLIKADSFEEYIQNRWK